MDFKDILETLDQSGRLVRVRSEVDLCHEAAGIAKCYEGKEVVLFEKLKGQRNSLAMGMYWNRENLAKIFETTAEKLPYLLASAVSEARQHPIIPVISANAPCQEVCEEEVNLYSLPIPVLALKDGGPYLDNCVVIAKDPDTNVRNASIHRLMVTGADRLGLLMDVGRHLRDYYERAEKKGKSLEITISNGVHPAYYFAATTPSSAVPIDQDELTVASALLKSPARLSQSRCVNVEGIADAQVVLEAEILPFVREPEGPFGEVSGYYASREDRWVVQVKAITHQKNPILSSLLPGKEVWNSIGLGVEPYIFETLSRQVQGVKNVYLSHGGSQYHAIIQMDPPVNGMSKNAILATFACYPALQMVTVVNSDVDLYDAEDVERAMVTRCDPEKDVIIIPRALGHELNPITQNGVGGKMAFDCTYPIPKAPKFEKIAFQSITRENNI